MANLTLDAVLAGIAPADKAWEAKAKDRVEALAVPPWSLGRLSEIGVRLCGMQRTLSPDVSKKLVITCGADEGVADEGVSAFPQQVTQEMLANIAAGGASINVLAGAAGAAVRLVDLGVKGDFPTLIARGVLVDRKIAYGSGNMRRGPAMTREQAVASLEAGIDEAGRAVAEDGVTLLATGDLGIGNTTPSAAILAVIGGFPVADVTGRGTGVDDAGLQNKIQVIEDAIALNRPDAADGLDVLAKVGGFDIGGIAGTILGAAYHRTPVLVDGFISTAGALIAKALCPAAADYMIAAHQSQEPGHTLMWQTLGIRPLLDLDMRLGEGTGAAVAMHLVECAARTMTDILTFEEAAVTGKN
jgi:nicotinate-nucleotide--dimethylbenzimidazole phosphoribosyltransferase